MRPWQRITVIEYETPRALHEDLASRCSVSLDTGRDLLLRAGDRLRNVLGMKSSPLFSTNDRFQFQNVAGLLVLGPGLELEVAPKFLGNLPGWREDFFLLATLSHHGRLFDEEGLKSSSQANSDLATLIGRSLVEMYWKNQRRPLRTYRRLHRSDFAIEGDFEPEDLLAASEEGFPQQVTSFTRENAYNAVIRSAAAGLAPVVPDVETRARLERLAQHLPSQPRPTRLHDRRLSSRSRAWQPTFDLSLDILRGLGGAYDPKNALSPGYVVQTWQVWEQLISLSLRGAFKPSNVQLQFRNKLGSRTQSSKTSDLEVKPDAIVSIAEASGQRRIIIDAKYKGNIHRSNRQVSNADIYEALAFSRATNIKEILLIYPAPADDSRNLGCEVGNATQFEVVEVGDIHIRAIEVGVRKISERDGLKKFMRMLKEEVERSTSRVSLL